VPMIKIFNVRSAKIMVRKTIWIISTIGALNACGNLPQVSSSTKDDEICKPFTLSTRAGTSNFGEYSKDCKLDNAAIWSFKYLNGQNPAEILFEMSAMDFPEQKDFLNKKIARWGILGFKISEKIFLDSTSVPLFKKGDPESIKKAKQLFLDFLLSQVPPTPKK
jgi:hypothetical protein